MGFPTYSHPNQLPTDGSVQAAFLRPTYGFGDHSSPPEVKGAQCLLVFVGAPSSGQVQATYLLNFDESDAERVLLPTGWYEAVAYTNMVIPESP